MATYNIVPIEGREVIQKNFISLPDKGDNYSGRRVSLNERFSIIERGYQLQPMDMSDYQPNVAFFKRYKERPISELKEVIEKETKQYRQHCKKNMKNKSSESISPPLSPKDHPDDDALLDSE